MFTIDVGHVVQEHDAGPGLDGQGSMGLPGPQSPLPQAVLEGSMMAKVLRSLTLYCQQ